MFCKVVLEGTRSAIFPFGKHPALVQSHLPEKNSSTSLPSSKHSIRHELGDIIERTLECTLNPVTNLFKSKVETNTPTSPLPQSSPFTVLNGFSVAHGLYQDDCGLRRAVTASTRIGENEGIDIPPKNAEQVITVLQPVALKGLATSLKFAQDDDADVITPMVAHPRLKLPEAAYIINKPLKRIGRTLSALSNGAEPRTVPNGSYGGSSSGRTQGQGGESSRGAGAQYGGLEESFGSNPPFRDMDQNSGLPNGDPGKDPEGMPPDTDQPFLEANGLKLACYLFKKDPDKYREIRVCAYTGWLDTRRLREHMKRCHGIETRGNIEGLTLQQLNTLETKRFARGMEEAQKWKETYQELFPDHSGPIPSPHWHPWLNSLDWVQPIFQLRLRDQLVQQGSPAGSLDDLISGVFKILRESGPRYNLQTRAETNFPDLALGLNDIQGNQIPNYAPRWEDFDDETSMNFNQFGIPQELLSNFLGNPRNIGSPIDPPFPNTMNPSNPSNPSISTLEMLSTTGTDYPSLEECEDHPSDFHCT